MNPAISHPAVRHALAALGIEYEIVACDPSLADTAAFCDAYGFDPEDSANCIVVASRRPAGQHLATLVLATTRLDVNGRCCELMGVRRASFAPPQQTAELTGMEIGGVTPFGLPNALIPVRVDAAVLERERVVVGGGDRSVKLVVMSHVFSRAPLFQVVQGLAVSFRQPGEEAGPGGG
ncbi:MAG TPA: YbaK/EbsC family protein [Candidatus Dormibacteraeota bacterium]|jgi:prolyl-tRNA editing enzyme YbaK/EbsC (Cys-tRNA(Pro) deacylase)